MTDLTTAAHYIAPDDGNRDDRTVLSVPLPTAVPPGGTVAVEIRWTAHVPRTFARTGAVGNFFFIAQWFPKLGVLEEDGWNTHQFHATTEFFSDYGIYDVRITVPRGWPVGATGRERSRDRHARREDDPPVRPGRRPRLRLDDEPGLRRAHREVRASAPCRRVDAASAAAGARRPGGTAFRCRARNAAVVRRVVRALSVRPHHDRRSRVAERRRRDGIPDALHRRQPLALAAIDAGSRRA